MRFGRFGREAQLHGLAAALDGGVLCLYDGPAPAVDAAPSPNSSLLAELPIVPGSLDVREGWLRFSIHAPGTVLGSATWFRVTSADGRIVGDGTVGRTEGDLVLPINLVQPGAEITVVGALTVPA